MSDSEREDSFNRSFDSDQSDPQQNDSYDPDAYYSHHRSESVNSVMSFNGNQAQSQSQEQSQSNTSNNNNTNSSNNSTARSRANVGGLSIDLKSIDRTVPDRGSLPPDSARVLTETQTRIIQAQQSQQRSLRVTDSLQIMNSSQIERLRELFRDPSVKPELGLGTVNDLYRGKLTLPEFVQAFAPLINKTRKEIKHLYLAIDANSDGTIDWEEFSNFMLTENSANQANGPSGANTNPSTVNSNERSIVFSRNFAKTTAAANKNLSLHNPSVSSHPHGVSIAAGVNKSILHTDMINKLLYLPFPYDRYVTVARDGQIKFWGSGNFQLIKSIQAQFYANPSIGNNNNTSTNTNNPSTNNPANITHNPAWLTDVCYLDSIHSLAVSSMDRTIILIDCINYELTGRIRANQQYQYMNPSSSSTSANLSKFYSNNIPALNSNPVCLNSVQLNNIESLLVGCENGNLFVYSFRNRSNWHCCDGRGGLLQCSMRHNHSIGYLNNILVIELRGLHQDWITKIHYDYRLALLITSSRDSTIKLLDFNKIENAVNASNSSNSNNTNNTIIDSDSHNTEATTTINTLSFGSSHNTGNIITNYYSSIVKKTFRGHSRSVFDFCYSRKYKFIASCGLERIILLWNPFTNTNKSINKLIGHNSSVLALSISDELNILISLSSDKLIKVWNMLNLTCIQTITDNLNYQYRPQNICTGIYLYYNHNSGSANTNNIPNTTGSNSTNSQNSNNITLIVTTNRLLVYSASSITHSSFTPSHSHRLIAALYNHNFNQIVSGDYSGRIIVWDLSTGLSVFQFQCEQRINAICFDSSERRLLTANIDGSLSLYNFSNGQELTRFLPNNLSNNNNSNTVIQPNEITAITYIAAEKLHSKSKYILSTGWDRRVSVWLEMKDSSEQELLFQMPKYIEPLANEHSQHWLNQHLNEHSHHSHQHHHSHTLSTMHGHQHSVNEFNHNGNDHSENHHSHQSHPHSSHSRDHHSSSHAHHPHPHSHHHQRESTSGHPSSSSPSASLSTVAGHTADINCICACPPAITVNPSSGNTNSNSASSGAGSYLIATGSDDGSIIIWHLDSAQFQAKLLPAHYYPNNRPISTEKLPAIEKLIYLERKQLLLSISADGYTRGFDLKLAQAKPNSNTVGANTSTNTNTNTNIAVNQSNLSSNIFELFTNQRSLDLSCISVDKSETYLFTGDAGGSIKLWDIFSLSTQTNSSTIQQDCRCLKYWQAHRKIIDPNTNTSSSTLNTQNLMNSAQSHRQSCAIVSIVYLPSYRLILTAASDGTIFLWTRETELIGMFRSHLAHLQAIQKFANANNTGSNSNNNNNSSNNNGSVDSFLVNNWDLNDRSTHKIYNQFIYNNTNSNAANPSTAPNDLLISESELIEMVQFNSQSFFDPIHDEFAHASAADLDDEDELCVPVVVESKPTTVKPRPKTIQEYINEANNVSNSNSTINSAPYSTIQTHNSILSANTSPIMKGKSIGIKPQPHINLSQGHLNESKSNNNPVSTDTSTNAHSINNPHINAIKRLNLNGSATNSPKLQKPANNNTTSTIAAAGLATLTNPNNPISSPRSLAELKQLLFTLPKELNDSDESEFNTNNQAELSLSPKSANTSRRADLNHSSSMNRAGLNSTSSPTVQVQAHSYSAHRRIIELINSNVKKRLAAAAINSLNDNSTSSRTSTNTSRTAAGSRTYRTHGHLRDYSLTPVPFSSRNRED